MTRIDELKKELSSLKLKKALLKNRVKFHNEIDYSIDELNEMIIDIDNQICELQEMINDWKLYLDCRNEILEND